MYAKYSKLYSGRNIKRKLRRIVRRVGCGAFRKILTLVVMLQSKDVPLAARLSIIGVLGYLICPIDLLPDFVPGGLVDDLAAIALLVSELAIFRTEMIETKVDELMKKYTE
jgi:uncharacterized membrane protein YkvA (DUF1232 family)